jgi:hypothetical protein
MPHIAISAGHPDVLPAEEIARHVRSFCSARHHGS